MGKFEVPFWHLKLGWFKIYTLCIYRTRNNNVGQHTEFRQGHKDEYCYRAGIHFSKANNDRTEGTVCNAGTVQARVLFDNK